MLKDLSKKIDVQSENLKNISKCFENVSFIIKNTENTDVLDDLKDTLTDLKPVLTDLENNLTDIETLITPTEVSSDIVSDNEQIYEENTLLISEIQNKVILPYSIDDLQKIIDTNTTFNSFREIIDKLYTIPITFYKSPSKARFKEAYRLMRKREKASVLSSLSLALELCFNSSLNPAIITACKNLDELDTYLDCLSENELNKFDLFNVKYEILPYK